MLFFSFGSALTWQSLKHHFFFFFFSKYYRFIASELNLGCEACRSWGLRINLHCLGIFNVHQNLDTQDKTEISRHLCFRCKAAFVVSVQHYKTVSAIATLLHWFSSARWYGSVPSTMHALQGRLCFNCKLHGEWFGSHTWCCLAYQWLSACWHTVYEQSCFVFIFQAPRCIRHELHRNCYEW